MRERLCTKRLVKFCLSRRILPTKLTPSFFQLASRIVRLNRPLLGRGYQPGSPYQYSTQQCIEFSRRLISSNAELLEFSPTLWLSEPIFACNLSIALLTLSRPLAYTGTLASALVLLMDLFHAIDTDEAESSIREVSLPLCQVVASSLTRRLRQKRGVLAKARVIFEKQVTRTPALEVVVEEGRKILS